MNANHQGFLDDKYDFSRASDAMSCMSQMELKNNKYF